MFRGNRITETTSDASVPAWEEMQWLCPISSKIYEIWDIYRLVVPQWLHIIRLRVQGGSFRCEAEIYFSKPLAAILRTLEADIFA